MALDVTTERLKALADPTRLRLLLLCDALELSVSELVRLVRQSQPRISRHLKILVEAGFLERSSEGSYAYFRRTADAAGTAMIAAVRADLAADPLVAGDRQRLKAVRKARAEAQSRYFRQHAQAWDQLRALHAPVERVEDALLRLAPRKAGRLLDLGTGTGRILELLAPRVEEGIGIDSSQEMLQIARVRLDEPGFAHLRLRKADIMSLPFEAGEFDLVTAHMVLHYLEDPGAAVAGAMRCLAPGGRLLIVDFAPHGEESLRAEHAHRHLGIDPALLDGLASAEGWSVKPLRRLAEGRLTVCLWLAEKPRPARAPVKARLPSPRQSPQLQIRGV